MFFVLICFISFDWNWTKVHTHTHSHCLYHTQNLAFVHYPYHILLLPLSQTLTLPLLHTRTLPLLHTLPHTHIHHHFLLFWLISIGDHGAQNTATITVGGQSVDRCQCLTSSSSSNLKWSTKYSWQGSGVRLKRLVYSNYSQKHLYTSSRQSLSNLHTHTHVANLPHIRPYPPPCPVQWPPLPWPSSLIA